MVTYEKYWWVFSISWSCSTFVKVPHSSKVFTKVYLLQNLRIVIMEEQCIWLLFFFLFFFFFSEVVGFKLPVLPKLAFILPVLPTSSYLFTLVNAYYIKYYAMQCNPQVSFFFFLNSCVNQGNFSFSNVVTLTSLLFEFTFL